jgi:molybdopterin converting factor small subunit
LYTCTKLDNQIILNCPKWQVSLIAQATITRQMAQIVKIKVTGYLKFRGLVGNEATLELETEKATLRDALKVLCNQHGERFESILLDPSTREIKRSNLVLLNGQPYINLGKRLDTELKDGDEITFSPVLAGG